MTDGQCADGTERRIRCSCGLQYGWFDVDDADHLGSHHAENCDGEVEYKEREKEGKNYSDHRIREDYLLTTCRHCDDGRDHECEFCGARFRFAGRKNDHEAGCMGP